MTTLREAAQAALDALDNMTDAQSNPARREFPTIHDFGKSRRAADALRTALAAQPITLEAHPDAKRWRWLAPRMIAADMDYNGDGVEALVFEMPEGGEYTSDCAKTIDLAMAKNAPEQMPAIATAIATAIAQPAPDADPVAWIDKHGNIDRGLDALLAPDGWTPLYAAAPIAQPAPDAAPAGWLCRTKQQVIDAEKAFPGEPHDYLWKYTHGTQHLAETEGHGDFDVVRLYAGAAPIAQQAAPAAEHRPGCEALGGYGHGVGACDCGAQPQRAAPAQAELESLRRDADRWRKLRDTPATSVAPGPMRGWLFMRPAGAESMDRMADDLPAAAMAKDAP
jgi:hypothetical protein